MRIEHISLSRLNVFNQCQQLYKYKYHLKIPSPIEEPFYFTYGKIVHKIAETYVENKKQIPLGQIALNIFDGKMPIEEGNPPKYAPATLPDDYRRRFAVHIKNLCKITDQLGFDGVVEYDFLYDLDPPNNRCVKGFIDRLIPKNNNKYVIIDYKTSKDSPYNKTQETIVHDLQLRIYARIIQKQKNIPAQNISAALYYLETGSLVGARFSEKSLAQAEEIFLNGYKQIENTNEHGVWGNVQNHCSRCDYRSICPFLKKEQVDLPGGYEIF